MGVYIPQLDMPTSCAKCGFSRRKENDYLFVGCQLILNVMQNARDGSRYRGCPLVEVPVPHGRLIDADEAFIDADERGFDFWASDADIDSAKEFLKAQPTIIEAEEE